MIPHPHHRLTVCRHTSRWLHSLLLSSSDIFFPLSPYPSPQTNHLPPTIHPAHHGIAGRFSCPNSQSSQSRAQLLGDVAASWLGHMQALSALRHLHAPPDLHTDRLSTPPLRKIQTSSVDRWDTRLYVQSTTRNHEPIVPRNHGNDQISTT